ncbi:PQQ-binding-like beta-propeller repeat protein [Candidatus Micrarchaeota archaeon]|nr:PQQ-binding-like beta-propeller repeat protein [Candidatus Micrarchaeota archaeon]
MPRIHLLSLALFALFVGNALAITNWALREFDAGNIMSSPDGPEMPLQLLGYFGSTGSGCYTAQDNNYMPGGVLAYNGKAYMVAAIGGSGIPTTFHICVFDYNEPSENPIQIIDIDTQVSPAIYKNILYAWVEGSQRLVAYDLVSNTIKWQISLDTSGVRGNIYHVPIVADDKVFMTTSAFMGPTRVWALDYETGAEVWKRVYEGQWSWGPKFAYMPAFGDGRLYTVFVNETTFDGSTQNITTEAIDADTGALIWQKSGILSGNIYWEMYDSAPVFHGGWLYTFIDTTGGYQVYRRSAASGGLSWSSPASTGTHYGITVSDDRVFMTRGGIPGAPLYAYALFGSDGSDDWMTALSSLHHPQGVPATLGNGLLYYSTRQATKALNSVTGEIIDGTLKYMTKRKLAVTYNNLLYIPAVGGGNPDNGLVAIYGTALPSNLPPNAEANGPYSGLINEVIPLVGMGWDEDGVITNIQWDISTHPECVLNNINVQNLNTETANIFADLACSSTGVKVITLIATDDDGLQASDTAFVAIGGVGSGGDPPVVEAGGPYAGEVDTAIPIFGFAYDDGSITALSWTSIPADCTLSNEMYNLVTDPATAYADISCTIANPVPKSISLEATDNDANHGTDDADLLILPVGGNFPPTVSIIAAPPWIEENTPFQVVAEGRDQDGNLVSVTWTHPTCSFVSANNNPPLPAPNTISTLTTSCATIGQATVTVLVTDNDGATASDQAVVQIVASGDEPEMTSIEIDSSDEHWADFIDRSQIYDITCYNDFGPMNCFGTLSWGLQAFPPQDATLIFDIQNDGTFHLQTDRPVTGQVTASLNNMDGFFSDDEPVTANPYLIEVDPSIALLPHGGEQQFAASCTDAGGTPMACPGPGTLEWSLIGIGGTIDATGHYSAPFTDATGQVRANIGSVNGFATVIVQETIPTPTVPPGGATPTFVFVQGNVLTLDCPRIAYTDQSAVVVQCWKGGEPCSASDIQLMGSSNALVSEGHGSFTYVVETVTDGEYSLLATASGMDGQSCSINRVEPEAGSIPELHPVLIIIALFTALMVTRRRTRALI